MVLSLPSRQSSRPRVVWVSTSFCPERILASKSAVDVLECVPVTSKI